ncbi:hypothetical protein [Streptomyces sp. NRRL S-118]|uniref:hypothetical protein n=1 Tax=Streptomyces sp. NRRL S-118 TaxID=1463881 RepID=UPI000A7B1E5F|nr:hypothetical protein [Streptomyces sp. NRRL S-118]
MFLRLGVMMDTTSLLVTDLEVDTVLADLTVPLAVRTVRQLLSESDVWLDEAVALDVPDVELADRLLGG